jgi:hypothetical protein
MSNDKDDTGNIDRTPAVADDIDEITGWAGPDN